eukprot:3938044-Alexandrium_andersonii.AAC.1
MAVHSAGKYTAAAAVSFGPSLADGPNSPLQGLESAEAGDPLKGLALRSGSPTIADSRPCEDRSGLLQGLD